MKKLYLVDVSSMFFRAFFAVPPMKTSEGIPTNALYGFLSMTIKLLKDVKPDYMVFCQDRPEPSFRKKLYGEYKANRSEMPEDLVPQMPYIKDLTDILGITQISKLGYEADDIIGSLAKIGESKGLEVVIVSGDKDFAQLINSQTIMFDTMKNKKYDVQGVVEKWGVNPDQFIDYLALIGDSSDNIPGVRGVGPKGAEKLLAAYKTLDGIYENIEEISGKSLKAKLIENKEMAYLSQKLVTIVEDLKFEQDIEEFKLKPVDRERLVELLKSLEFKSFEKKLFSNIDEAESDKKKEPKKVKSTSKKEVKSKPKETTAISEDPQIPVEGVAEWSCDEFQKNVEPYSDLWVMDTERGVYFSSGKNLFCLKEEPEKVGALIDQKQLNWKGFDLKKTWHHFSVKDPIVGWDQMLANYVVRPGGGENFEEVIESQLGEKIPDLAPPNLLLKLHLQLEKSLKESLKKLNGESVLADIEHPLIPILYSMERAGIEIDKEELGRQSKDLEKHLVELEKSIHKEAGTPFNVASPKQLGEILFGKLGLPALKKTKTGYSTSSDVLMQLVDQHPICQMVMDYREDAKLKSTYVDSLPLLVDEKTNRVHTRFRQAVTTTGRLSSVHPNLQNIPIRTEKGRRVRQAFVAREGCSLFSIDYSQIELRVLAHITNDPGLLKAFENNLDVHTATASEIYGVELSRVTPEQRRSAKAVNFGIAYGQGAYGLAETLGISRKEGKEIIEKYFSKFPNIKDYMQTVVEKAYEDGYVEMLSGRRRYLTELESKNAAVRKFGERAAINAPMQGTASDIVKLAMISVFDNVEAKMLLQVHDELVFECPDEILEEQMREAVKLMESAFQLKVPLLVSSNSGKNWDEAH